MVLATDLGLREYSETRVFTDSAMAALAACMQKVCEVCLAHPCATERFAHNKQFLEPKGC